jgi:hypothetical protein
MRGIMEYAAISEEVPFARPLPRVPMLRVPELPPRYVRLPAPPSSASSQRTMGYPPTHLRPSRAGWCAGYPS